MARVEAEASAFYRYTLSLHWMIDLDSILSLSLSTETSFLSLFLSFSLFTQKFHTCNYIHYRKLHTHTHQKYTSHTFGPNNL